MVPWGIGKVLKFIYHRLYKSIWCIDMDMVHNRINKICYGLLKLRFFLKRYSLNERGKRDIVGGGGYSNVSR